MKTLVLTSVREGYSADQVKQTISVGELKTILSMCDDDMPIVISADGGYMYGSINLDRTRIINTNK